MKFKEFQQNTIRTLPNLHKKYVGDTVISDAISPIPIHLLDLIHMRLGMVSEISELLNGLRKEDSVNIGEELADQLWYVANDLTICKKIKFIDESDYNTFAKIEFTGQPMATDGGLSTGDLPPWLPALVYNSAELADQVKKWLAYGKVPKKEEYIKLIQYLLGAINNMSRSRDINLEDYMEKVINKLKIRYPHSFSEERAQNRDLAEERKVLEK